MISEDSNDYRRELAAARRAVEGLPRDGSPATLDACWEVCCGDVLIAEENLAAQDRVWENAALARELLSMATYLEGYDSMLDGLRSALARMADALYDHPRLKLSLLEFELQVIYRLEALCDGESSLSDSVQEQIDFLRRNIARADRGEWTRIEPSGNLKRDPIEWSAGYERVIDEADEKACALVADRPRTMGFCFAWWHAKAEVLRADYGLEWRSPALMNPGVRFD